VDDYLRFVAAIRGVPKDRRKAAIARAVELCSLSGVLGKNIVELSKGFRQRVGLAQAMVHEPEVLILDEPTSGLDPNQIVEVRHLIAQLLGEQRTVILSTHYLQEVEKSCSRVIIITHGRIVADDTQEQLIAALPRGAVRARIRGPEANVLAQLAELLPGKAVDVVERQADEAVYRVGVSGHAAPIEEALARLVVKNGWALLELGRERGTLEDVFRNLTTQPQAALQPEAPPAVEAAHA
jgi:ABC-2 type transport system ATP-binding protein